MIHHGSLSLSGMLLFFVSFCPTTALAVVEFTKCTDVSSYLNKPFSNASIDRVDSLKNAVALVKQERENPQENCDDRLTYRTLFDYASALDGYSKTFETGSKSQKNWSLAAASAYEEHLQWFFGLSAQRRETLIEGLLGIAGQPLRSGETKASNESFAKDRGRWLRTKPGLALFYLGNAFKTANEHARLLTTYEKFTAEDQSPAVFSDEAVDLWYTVLRMQPKFLGELKESDMKQCIANNEPCRDRWANFNRFLSTYIQTSIPKKDQWEGKNKRITEWLDVK